MNPVFRFLVNAHSPVARRAKGFEAIARYPSSWGHFIDARFRDDR
jgi:hypothetical protein